MLMHAIAHGACTSTERESALKVDIGRKERKKEKKKTEKIDLFVCLFVAALGNRPRVIEYCA